jgi:hypothetical protein
MVNVSIVAVISLICSLVQLIYTGGIIVLLRQRKKIMRASLEGLPTHSMQQQQQQKRLTPGLPAGQGTEQNNNNNANGKSGGQHQSHLFTETNIVSTLPAYYEKFLPTSYHSVPPPREDQLLDSGNVGGSDFSYQSSDGTTSHTISPNNNAFSPPPWGSSGRNSVVISPEQEAAAGRAALRARVATPAVTKGSAIAAAANELYSEEDVFRNKDSNTQEDDEDTLAAVEQAAFAHGVHLRSPPPRTSVLSNGSNGSNGSNRSILSQQSPTTSIAEEEEDDEEVFIPASMIPLSPAGYLSSGMVSNSQGSLNNSTNSGPIHSSSSIATSPFDCNPEEMQVSLDSDDLSQPPHEIEVVLDDETAGNQIPRRTVLGSFGSGNNTASSSIRNGQDESGHMVAISMESSSPKRGAVIDPAVTRVLHVSAAPFAPEHPTTGNARNRTTPSATGDAYVPLSDGTGPISSNVSSRRASTSSQHSQSRMIAHPRSLGSSSTGSLVGSASRPDGVLRAAALAAAVDDVFSTPRDRRRASMTRKLQQYNNGGPSISNNAGGVPIPVRQHINGRILPLDPNASPVRSKVTFADSPRDRAKWAQNQFGGGGNEKRANISNETAPSTVVSKQIIGFGPIGGSNAQSDSSTDNSIIAATTSSSNGVSNNFTSPPTSPRTPQQQEAPRAQRAQSQLTPNGPRPPSSLGGVKKSNLKKSSSLVTVSPSPGPSPSTSLFSVNNLLVLPAYYRFLLLQCVNCTLWALACIVLLGFNENLVGWKSASESSAQDAPQPSWIFSILIASLLGFHALIFDGLFVFLSARHVGRSSIQFATWFGFIWGIAIAATIIGSSHVVSPSVTSEHEHGWLRPTNPFFIRSISMFLLNLFILCAPKCCVCDARARRSNSGRKSAAERVLALERQYHRRLLEAEFEIGDDTLPEDSFENDPDAYEDGTQPRNTYVGLALFNLIFRALLLVMYFLDFKEIGSSVTTHDSEDESIWEGTIMSLLAIGFLSDTPILYFVLTRDSNHWQNEWTNALQRMKNESEINELKRMEERKVAIQSMRERGLDAEADVMEKALLTSQAAVTQPPLTGSFTSLYTSKDSFFIDYSLLTMGTLLGSGGFSSVYAAKLAGKLDVAVKVLHVRSLSTEIVDQFLHEVGIVLQFRHPNVVPFLGVVFSPPDMLLIMAQCRRHSLLDLIKQRKVLFTEFQAVSIALAIADGLRYIHERDILHRDLKVCTNRHMYMCYCVCMYI